jgi:D-aminopeptidase
VTVNVFISTDIEGTAGIVDWQQVLGPGPEYELGRQLLTDEVNAAIDGAVEAGARHILVNDAHWTMQNMRPGALHHEASYLSGKHKPLYMMEGLDATFDAVFMVAYHGGISAERAILSHTYNPFAVWEARLNGVPVGESALNALVALHHRVPVVLITGDDATAAEAQPFMPGIETVVVCAVRLRVRRVTAARRRHGPGNGMHPLGARSGGRSSRRGACRWLTRCSPYAAYMCIFRSTSRSFAVRVGCRSRRCGPLTASISRSPAATCSAS